MARRRKGPPLELSWPGKTEAPRRLSVDPNALQTLEIHGGPAPTGTEPNRLVRGDNLIALAALEERYAGQAQLVYIDPPYATGMSYFAQTGRDGAVSRRAYRDQFEDGLAGYIAMMRDRLAALRRLLADDGALFLHCDWRANSALRLLLDELFGPACHRNEIIWRRAPNLGRQAASKQLGRVYDSILVYSRTPGSRMVGEAPRRLREVEYDRKGKPKGARWDEGAQAYFTTAPRGDYTDASIARLRGENRVYDSPSGKVYIKYFLTPGSDGRWFKDQPVDALWDDFEVRPLRHRPKAEDMGYDTQKPEGLLERIVRWASRPGDLVVDAFCGSGTTLAVAERLGRRWLGVDGGPLAIGVTRRRLWELGAAFAVASVEEEEWRRWVAGLEADEDARLVLEASGAAPLEGRKGERGDQRLWVAPLDGAATTEEVLRAGREGAQVVLARAYVDDAEAVQRALAAAGLQVETHLVSIEIARRAVRKGTLTTRVRPRIEARRSPEGVVTLALVDAPSLDAPKEAVTGWMVGPDRAPFAPTWQHHRSLHDRTLPWQTPPLAIPARVRVVAQLSDGSEATTTA